MAYPDSYDAFVPGTDGTGPRDTTASAVLTAAEWNAVLTAIGAIQAELGLTPSAAFATVTARLTSLDGSLSSLSASVATQADAAAASAALALKADLASPALTGNPTAPTQAPGDDSTRIATTAFVEARASAIDGGTA